MRFIFCGYLFFLLSLSVVAQTPAGSLRTHMADAQKPVQVLDSFTIATLVRVVGTAQQPPLPNSLFRIQNNALCTDTTALRRLCPTCRVLFVTYRVLPFNMGIVTRRLDTGAIRRYAMQEAIEYDFRPYKPPGERPWEGGSLNANGAYTRGLSLGNSQNLVFNSNLNLQLGGKLGNDLEIQAALSDNTIPLQPDGTTRQINEFDRIFIQIKQRNNTLTAGDYDLTRPAGYFSNYFKRLQGAMLEHHTAVPRPARKWNDTLSVRAAAAISRGKFARQNIQGQEGNQGPYRLQGAEGERFIIVLAGTEKVFIDGQLLRRGLQDDYIMDYNLGEITFMARRLITKDIRIIVEFEYAVQNFLRSNLATDALWHTRRTKTYFHLYSEQDSRNSSSAQDLSTEERRILAQSGDNLRAAFSSGIDTLADFDASRVLYRSVDTLICGAPVSILTYSTDPQQAKYAVRFTEVPAGQGNYVQALSAANGRVYRWVSPDPLTCQPRGQFEPVVRLLAPELRQLYTLGTEMQWNPKTFVRTEAAVSNRDLNRFSPLGNTDDLGWAGMVFWKQDFSLGKKNRDTTRNMLPLWQGQTEVFYEHTSRYFLPLNPYRLPEFVRDWNVNNSRDTVAENIWRGMASVRNAHWGTARYELSLYNRQGIYAGNRQIGQLRLQQAGFVLQGDFNLLLSDGLVEKTRFERPKIDFSKTFNASKNRKALLKTGFYGERERNRRIEAGRDTLSHASFWYDLGRIYLQTVDPARPWQWGGFVAQRNDYFPTPAGFRQNTKAQELNLNGSWNNALHPRPPASPPSPVNHLLTWNLSWRDLRVIDPRLTTQKPQKTWLGRADYNFMAFKNALSLQTGYELGSGQTPKIEFTYLLVNPGQGQYTWVDRNRDSILQTDEMEVAVFQDQARYVRVGLTTTEYVRTNNLVFNQNLRLEPRLVWARNPRRTKRMLSRFSTQSTFQINRRTYAGAANVQPWNPFLWAVPDTQLVALTASARNVLFINRAQPRWDASLSYGSQSNQVTLNTGFERRQNNDLLLHGRWNFNQLWTIEAHATKGNKNSDHQVFNTRDFAITYLETGPKLTWVAQKNLRFIAQYAFQKSRNTLSGGEKADQTHIHLETTWNPAGKENTQGFRASTSVRLKCTFARIRYTGQPNTAVAFNMLEGLQNGRNVLWSILADRQLSKTLQISVNYEGRKTGSNRTIHVGRAQVRALF